MGLTEELHLLAGRLGQITDEVLYHRKQEVSRSARLDRLYAEAGNVGGMINSIMCDNSSPFIDVPLEFDGKEIKAEIADYCLRHYSSGGIAHVNDRREYGTFALESALVVIDFVEAIKKLRGQKVATCKGESPLEKGVINGECKFVRDKSFRYLFIPVERKKVLRKNSNFDDPQNIFVNPDFFSLSRRGLSSCIPNEDGVSLATNYTEPQYPPGTVPENIHLYAGDTLANLCAGL